MTGDVDGVGWLAGACVSRRHDRWVVQECHLRRVRGKRVGMLRMAGISRWRIHWRDVCYERPLSAAE